MVFIKVNLISLRKFSRNLDLWRTDAVNARNDGYKQCSVEDPADIADFFGPNATMQLKLTDLFHLKGSLDTRIVNVEAVNKTGVNSTDDSSGGYYLPDGMADTTENVTAYNKHAIDVGEALGKKLKNECTSSYMRNDEVFLLLQEIQKHQDIPTFGAAFMSQFDSPGQFTGCVSSAYSYCQYAPDPSSQREQTLNILGHTFAAATQHQNGANGTALANLYADSLTKTSGFTNTASGEHMMAFNALLDCTDAVYGTEFLVTTANRLETFDPSKVYPADPYFMSPYESRGVAQDPMFGVVSAMGRNSEAALTYMTQDGHMEGDNWMPGDKSEQRWINLSKRSDSRFVEAFSGMMAAASGYRNTPSDPNDPLYKPSGKGAYREYVKNGDARATWLTGVGLRHFSEDVSKDKFTEKIKANVGTMLANSPEELSAATLGLNVAELDENGNPKFSKGPTINGKVDNAIINKLLYRVVDNESAVTGINASLGAYHHGLIEEAKKNGSVHNSHDLAQMYKDASKSQNYLSTVSDMKLKDVYHEGTAEYQKRKSKADTANAVFSTIAVTGVTAATAPIGGATAVLAPAITGVGLSLAEPFDAGFYADPKSGIPGGKEGMATPEELLRASAYADAADQGLLSEEHVKEAKRLGVLYDKKGKVVHPDATSFTEKNWESMNGWRDSASKNVYEPGSNGVKADETVLSIDSSIDDGIKEGEKSADEKFKKNPSFKS